MTPLEFTQRGCYVCGSHNLVTPFIPVDSDSTAPINNPKSVLYNPNAPITGLPTREPYLKCEGCQNEFTVEYVSGLDPDTWSLVRERYLRRGEDPIQEVRYHSEAQFDPQAMARGYLLQEEEDVERPG